MLCALCRQGAVLLGGSVALARRRLGRQRQPLLSSGTPQEISPAILEGDAGAGAGAGAGGVGAGSSAGAGADAGACIDPSAGAGADNTAAAAATTATTTAAAVAAAAGVTAAATTAAIASAPAASPPDATGSKQLEAVPPPSKAPPAPFSGETDRGRSISEASQSSRSQPTGFFPWLQAPAVATTAPVTREETDEERGVRALQAQREYAAAVRARSAAAASGGGSVSRFGASLHQRWSFQLPRSPRTSIPGPGAADDRHVSTGRFVAVPQYAYSMT